MNKIIKIKKYSNHWELITKNKKFYILSKETNNYLLHRILTQNVRFMGYEVIYCLNSVNMIAISKIDFPGKEILLTGFRFKTKADILEKGIEFLN